MKNCSILLAATLLISCNLIAAPKCKEVFLGELWRDNTSRYFTQNSDPTRVLKVYDRAFTTREDYYPELSSTFDILRQEALSLKILGQLIWRSRVPLRVVQALDIQPDNPYNIKEQYFDYEIPAYINDQSIASSMAIEKIEGVLLLDLIYWLNGKRKISPLENFNRSNATALINEFNTSLINLHKTVKEFAKVNLETNRLEVELTSNVPYTTLDVTMTGQQSLLPNGEIQFSISPATTLVTPAGGLVIVSPLN